MTRRHPLVAVLGFGLCAADAAPGPSQSYAPGLQPEAEERAEIRRFLDEADSWSHHFFTMRFVHPFDSGQSRYLVVGTEVIVVEEPDHQVEYWTAQLVGPDVTPHEPFRIRRRDMDLPPRIHAVDVDSDGRLDMLICRDGEGLPKPWAIAFDEG